MKNIIKWMPVIDNLAENETQLKKESLCEYAERHFEFENKYISTLDILTTQSTLPISLKILSQCNIDVLNFHRNTDKKYQDCAFSITLEKDVKFGVDTLASYESELINQAVEYINNNIGDKKLYTNCLVKSITTISETTFAPKMIMICNFSILN